MAGDTSLWARKPFDMAGYLAGARSRCFICALRDDVPGCAHEVIADEPHCFAFLDKFPFAVGHALVVPREHREEVIDDFSDGAYAALQGMIRRVGAALEKCVPCERLYILSLGSKQANAHVHWHLVPCPPGLPYEQQQIELLRGDYLDIPADETRRLADRLRAALATS